MGDAGQNFCILVTGSAGFIGSALVDSLLSQDMPVLGIDIREPMNKEHVPFWKQVDILDKRHLSEIISTFAPTHIIHLAARTDLGLNDTIAGFRANTDGVRNVLEVSNGTQSVERVIFTSTILVCEAGYVPKEDDNYCPNTPYGLSKVIGEKIVREGTIDSRFTWCIVRPTSIWGPGYGSHYVEFFKRIAKGIYFHPGTAENRVVYGYLGNCVYQIERIMAAETTKVHQKVFYLGDYWATGLKDWAMLIQRELGKGRLMVLPDPLVRTVAICGDILWHFGWKKVPLTSFRLKNMSTDRLYDTSGTQSVVGQLPYTQEQGVHATIAWLKAQKGL